MTITVRAKSNGQRITESENGSAELAYIITGTTDAIEAKIGLISWAPTIYDGKVVQSYAIEEFVDGGFEGIVQYGTVAPREPGTQKISFDTGGGTAHITQSLGTRSYAPEGQTAPDFKGAIGVTLNGVEGVDVEVPTFNFQITHTHDIGILTQGYILTLYLLTGTVNDRQFRGFAPGELKFLGASVTSQDEETCDITYSFAASPNATNLSIGDITGIEKKGWEYLWVRYEDAVDEEVSVLIKRPLAVYVEKVNRDGNFALLGI